MPPHAPDRVEAVKPGHTKIHQYQVRDLTSSLALQLVEIPTTSSELLARVREDERPAAEPQVPAPTTVAESKNALLQLAGAAMGTLQLPAPAQLAGYEVTARPDAPLALLVAYLSSREISPDAQNVLAENIRAQLADPEAQATFAWLEAERQLPSGVIVAAALAAAIERSILGEHPVFEITQSYGLHHASSLLLYAALGLASAAVSVLFTDSLLSLRSWFQRIRLVPTWSRPGIGGLMTGVLAVAALGLLKTGGITGGGYETLSEALSGNLAVRVLLALCAMKLAASCGRTTRKGRAPWRDGFDQ